MRSLGILGVSLRMSARAALWCGRVRSGALVSGVVRRCSCIFVLDVAGGDPAEVAVEDKGPVVWILSGFRRKHLKYSLPFCGRPFKYNIEWECSNSLNIWLCLA